VGDPLRFRLVDMPGYGYAKAPKDMVRQWRFLVNDYLRGRAVLKRTLVLIDSRHGIKDVDRDIMKMLDDAAVSYRIVMTKADKIKASELEAVTAQTLAEIRKRPAAFPEIIATSSEKGMGIPELRAAVIDSLT
jgi:GTP-binding protein